MLDKIPCIFNWSGGKDSTLALHHALQDETLAIKYLVTTVTDEFNRVSMHGVRESLLIKQAESIGIPLYQIRLPEMPTMEAYDAEMKKHMQLFKNTGITHAIFGDIFLEDLRLYREAKLAEVGMKAIFPLWKKDTKLLIESFIDLGYKTVVVCTQQNLKSLCGKIIDKNLIINLSTDIDPCGENGEFHTFAFDGPLFSKKINFEIGELVFKSYKTPRNVKGEEELSNEQSSSSGFWFIDLI